MEFASRTAILFAVVFILIKIKKLDQKLKFHFLKVLAVVALASGLDMIPDSGHYISVLVLLLGIKLATGASYTNLLFTVGFSYGLMFVANLFVISSLMGDLRPSARNAGKPAQPDRPAWEQIIETEPDKVPKTNPPVPTVVSNPPAPTVVSNPPAPTVVSNPPAPTVVSNPAPAAVTRYTIKGVTRNGAKSVVTVDTGTKAYTLFLGDTLNMQTTDGTSRVRFENLDVDWVTLNIDGKPLKLWAH